MFHYNTIFLAGNPFFEAYLVSDIFGKLIFIALFALSIISWVVIIQKLWQTHQAKRSAESFQEAFQFQRLNPLSLECNEMAKKTAFNPFLELYQVLKKQSAGLLNRNSQHLGHSAKPSLTLNDLDLVASHLVTAGTYQIKSLEKNLYILSITMGLAPFLGLLGTVWGILTTFSELQNQGAGGSHQMILGGLSMALATTVVGLIDAIPALIGYNYLKNSINDFSTDMAGFSHEMLASVELQYRQVDEK